VNSRFVKPLDRDLLCNLALLTKKVLIVEENVLMGGFGSAVLEMFGEEGISGVAVKRVGISDEFVEHGTQSELRLKYGLDEEGIARAARMLVKLKC